MQGLSSTAALLMHGHESVKRQSSNSASSAAAYCGQGTHSGKTSTLYVQSRASTMAEFTGGDDYQAEFDPKAYLEYYKLGEGTLGEENLNFVLKHYCKTFTSGMACWWDLGLSPDFSILVCDMGNQVIIMAASGLGCGEVSCNMH